MPVLVSGTSQDDAHGRGPRSAPQVKARFPDSANGPQLEQTVAAFREAFPDLSMTVEDVVAEGTG